MIYEIIPVCVEYLMDIDSELRSKETWLISEDGLWDICFGLSLLGIRLTISLSHPIWFIGFIMLAYFLVIMAGKEVITRPRMVYFSIQDRQLVNLSKLARFGFVFICLSLITGAAAFWIFDTGSSLNWLPENGVTILSFSIAVILCIFGLITRGGHRYYLYAGFSFLGFVMINLVNISSISFVYSAALFLTISGVSLLIRFITRYPKSNTRENVQL